MFIMGASRIPQSFQKLIGASMVNTSLRPRKDSFTKIQSHHRHSGRISERLHHSKLRVLGSCGALLESHGSGSYVSIERGHSSRSICGLRVKGDFKDIRVPRERRWYVGGE
jgi:hypothetical protein